MSPVQNPIRADERPPTRPCDRAICLSALELNSMAGIPRIGPPTARLSSPRIIDVSARPDV